METTNKTETVEGQYSKEEIDAAYDCCDLQKEAEALRARVRELEGALHKIEYLPNRVSADSDEDIEGNTLYVDEYTTLDPSMRPWQIARDALASSNLGDPASPLPDDVARVVKAAVSLDKAIAEFGTEPAHICEHVQDLSDAIEALAPVWVGGCPAIIQGRMRGSLPMACYLRPRFSSWDFDPFYSHRVASKA